MCETVKGISENKDIEQFVILYSKSADYELPLPESNIFYIGTDSRLASLNNLYKCIKSIKPDIVHVWSEVHFTLLSLIIFKYIFNYKLITGFIADGNPYPSFIVKEICKLSYKAANCVISNSKAGLIAKNAPLNKAVVIYNCFSPSRLVHVSESYISNFRKELCIESKYIVSMVARFRNDKDYDMFIDVAKEVSMMRKDIVFVAVGKGPNLDSCIKKAERLKLNNIHFLGFRSDIDTIFAASTVSLLFTNCKVHAEGVSNSIMESMASGVPVIATAGGGTEEIIDNNEDGIVIPPSNVSEAVKNLVYLIDNKNIRLQFGELARQKIKKCFNVETSNMKNIEVYNSLFK
jgi:glycosyltransferase involved in cell wall biosynthesis